MDALIHCLSANLGLVQNKSMLECQAFLSMYGEKTLYKRLLKNNAGIKTFPGACHTLKRPYVKDNAKTVKIFPSFRAVSTHRITLFLM